MNVDVTDIKMATGSWYCLSFSALIRQPRTAGVETKAFKFTVWDGSRFPFISETSNFRLLFMTSGTTALSCFSSLLQTASSPSLVSRVKARQDLTGERNFQEGNWKESERGPTPVSPRLTLCFFFFRSHRSISSLARPPWGTARSLMWLKRSKLPYLPWLRFLNPFFFQWIRVRSWWRTSNRRLGPGFARHVRRWAPWTRCSASVRIWGIPRGR